MGTLLIACYVLPAWSDVPVDARCRIRYLAGACRAWFVCSGGVCGAADKINAARSGTAAESASKPAERVHGGTPEKLSPRWLHNLQPSALARHIYAGMHCHDHRLRSPAQEPQPWSTSPGHPCPGPAACREGRAKRFVPFMEGPRSCAGQALASMNLTATLALLYGRFSFRLADEVCPGTQTCAGSMCCA